jgi:UDP-N-acetylglucosamine diphosphorylase / glucose-1-phosphate thymidylyltransferase / UDP-N-acetylgalactosamine diphosphorylase / glucosamine-1-phosphate N-acetyltransferase / galactosamine-1-phosphate N-acetyltransferase
VKIVFVDGCASYYSFLDHDDSDLANTFPSNCSLNIFGKSIITNNIDTLNSLYNIEKIVIPKTLSFLTSLIDSSFDIVIEENIDTQSYKNFAHVNLATDIPQSNYKSYTNGNKIDNKNNFNNLQQIMISSNTNLIIPCNILLGINPSTNNLEFQKFNYPWEFLDIVNNLLHCKIKDTIISNKSHIAKSSVIEGPCIIEDDVVGMGSLIRSSMLGNNTRIGFTCEIAKSYFAGYDRLSHHNVILDSLIGKNVWMGGYSGTANVLLNQNNVRYKLDGQLIDTGRAHFGSVVSNNSSIGASVIILPGRKVPTNSVIPAGTIYQK